MYAIPIAEDAGEEAFRAAARSCIARGLAPDEVLFSAGDSLSLFADDLPDDLSRHAPEVRVNVPRAYGELVRKVVCHNDADRFALLYRLLWRLHRGERQLLNDPTDADAVKAQRYAKAVDKDVYRMHAYVRFAVRKLDGSDVFVAWHEPQHRVLELAAPFFVDRFSNMDWLIATQLGTIAWRDRALSFGPPATRPAENGDAVLDEVWTTYYRTTFNPARLRVKAMVAQMPKRHWVTMPETASIRDMVRGAGARVTDMAERAPVEPPRFAQHVAQRMAAVSAEPRAAEPLETIHQEVRACRVCPLHGPAVQAVPGEGAKGAQIMFVGEQPGDQEDLAGKPFVGPAGEVFDRALTEAGIDRRIAYVTNAVKHFKFEPRGKRRVHMKPSQVEVTACRPWLEREIFAVEPNLIVALGATAMLSLTGRAVPVTKLRGQVLTAGALSILVTVHPSYVLRLPERDRAAAEYERFVADLRRARAWCEAA